jgi:hypothetical protein
MSITKYEFEMLSDPKCLSFHHDDWEDGDKLGVPIQQYRKILFSDSLFNFFPYCEVYFKDTAGQIIDNLFFIEGLQFNCKLGFIKNEEDKTELDKNNKSYVDYLEHSYIWSENEINNINMSSSISGDNVFLMISKFFYNDMPKSKTFNHENSSKKYTISNLLKEIILPQWGIPSSKYQDTISDTDGTPYINQNNITNQKFISKLAEYSYSKNFTASGFYTFINCNGEFYFMTINELMNQNPVHEFEIDLTDKMFINKNYIKDYRVRFGGVPINYDNYNRKIYTYQSTGSILAEERNIHDSIKNFDNDAYLLIRNTYIPKGGVDKINSKVIYGGVQQEENNKEYYEGYKNYFYNDTALSYRMTIVIDFDPNCVSGKTVTIKILKQSKDNEIAKEFSGNWLICESSHIMGKEGIPYSQLTLTKPKIKLDSDHPFIGDFKA